VAEDEAQSVSEANARLFRVLGNPTRLAIVRLLMRRPHTVTELTDQLGLGQSRVSNHLACLRWCRLVDTESQGRQVVYSISDQRLARLLPIAAEIADDNADLLANARRTGPDWL
jgi:ArsR family transcriptional regulator, cadmium/lead-responsive transcriptional repressor